MSNIVVRKFKNLNTRQKIYLGIALFLFLLQFLMGEDPSAILYPYTDSRYIAMFSIIGLVIALLRRNKSRKDINDKSLTNIIYSDYNLSSYASLSLLSLLYAILQGFFLGAGLGFIFYGVGCLFYGSLDWFGINFAGCFVCIGFTILTRIAIEGTSLIFRVAGDISKAVNKSI